MYLLPTILLPLTALAAKVTNPQKVPKNAVLLSKVKSLTVRAGQKTASRRVTPVPQLQCLGPADVCNLYEVDVMRCTNEGSDYDAENIQWSCKASLPEDFKLGSTDVSCEGYESSEDPFVLKGSCGVEYRLLLTETGETKYGKVQNDDQTWTGQSPKSETLAGYLFAAIFLAVLFMILRGIYRAWQDDNRPRGGRPPRNYGGGGGGPGDDDPPPPYDPSDYGAPPKKPRTYTPRTNTQSRTSSSSSSRSTAAGQQQAWRPGFWTGAAAGAAGTYFASTRNQGQTAPQQPQMQQRNEGGWFSGWGGGGGGGNNQRAQANFNVGGYRPANPPTPGSSTPSHSATRHESTGFGSTSRR